MMAPNCNSTKLRYFVTSSSNREDVDSSGYERGLSVHGVAIRCIAARIASVAAWLPPSVRSSPFPLSQPRKLNGNNITHYLSESNGSLERDIREKGRTSSKKGLVRHHEA